MQPPDDQADLAREIAKLLLANSLDYIRGTNQVMQALTSLLLTSYVTVFVALGKTVGFFELSPLLTGLPIALFAISLVMLFARAATYKGVQFTYGDIESTVRAYEQAIQERRRQLLLPAIFTLMGIAAVAWVVAVAV